MTVFISHIHEEGPVAKALKEWIESTFSVEVFVSSDIRDLPAGSRWLNEIDTALNTCRVFIVLCSPRSIQRPWINFEAGCGWIKKIPLIPVCHSGQLRDALPPPLSFFQAIEISSKTFVTDLLSSIANHLSIIKIPRINAEEMKSEILKAISLAQGASSRLTTVKASDGVDFDEETNKIIHFLASRDSDHPTAEEIAGHLHIHIIKCKFYLDILKERQIVGDILYMGRPAEYYLKPDGRKYAVEKNLID